MTSNDTNIEIMKNTSPMNSLKSSRFSNQSSMNHQRLVSLGTVSLGCGDSPTGGSPRLPAWPNQARALLSASFLIRSCCVPLFPQVLEGSLDVSSGAGHFYANRVLKSLEKGVTVLTPATLVSHIFGDMRCARDAGRTHSVSARLVRLIQRPWASYKTVRESALF